MEAFPNNHDFGNHFGTLENDPHHASTLASDDTIRLHSLHVMAILDEDVA